MQRKITKLFTLIAFIGVNANITASAITEEHYQRGRELMDMGRWVDAHVELNKAKQDSRELKELPQQRIDYALSQCAVRLEYLGAEQGLIDFENDYPQAPYHNDILFIRGLIEAANDNNAEAMELLELVKSDRLTKEDQERYNIRMGYLLFFNEDYPTAENYLNQIEKESRFYAHALYCKSYIAYSNGDYTVAKEGFEELLNNETFSPIAPYYLLQVEFLMGNYERSIEYGEGLLDSSMEQQQIFVVRTLAEAHFRLEQYYEALALIDKYAAAGGALGREEYYIEGFSLHQLERYEEAIEPLKKSCGADDEMTQNASFHLANCYLKSGDKNGAKSAFSMAANDKFNDQIAEEALFNYAKLQYELNDGHFNESVNLLTRYINTYNNPERLTTARTLLVAAYYNTRDYETAYNNIALIEDPDSEIKAAKQKITYLRGLESYNKGDYDQAAQYLEESMNIGVTAKQIALASYWIGETEYLQDNYQDAVARYNYFLARAPKSEPTTVEAQYSLGYAMLKMGNTKSALDYFSKFVKSDEANSSLKADAYNRIGDIYYGSRSYTLAADNYWKSISIGGAGSNYARYQVAIIKGLSGNQKSKITELKGITSPQLGAEILDDAKYELGRTYISTEQYNNAIRSHKEFLEQYPDSPLFAQALSDLGLAYINIGDSKSSLDYYDRAIKYAPQSEVAKDAMQGVREIHINDGDADGYFKYAESMGMEGDLNAVTRDSLSFASARGLYFAGSRSKEDIKRAADALKEYAVGYPNGYYLNDALFYLSDSYIKIGDNNGAIESLEKLGSRGVNQYSESLYSKLATLYFEDSQYAKSAKASRNLYDVTKSEDVRQQAMNQYIDALVLDGDNTALQTACKEIISLGEKRVGESATTKAKYYYATDLRERGERNEAMKIYEELAANKSEFQSEACYYTIESRYRAGDKERAKEMIFKLSEQREVDPYWLAKSFILLGDIYVAEQDNFQARATYQSIVDGYADQSDGIVDEAKSKIGELK